MMEPVADNAPPPGPAGPPPGEEPTPPRGELIVPPQTAPAPIDPDEVRQFQEFKQFQELMRQQKEHGFQQGQPPPPGFLQPWGPPPPKENPVKRAAKAAVGKIITGLIVLAVLVLGGYLAIDYFFGGPPSEPPASQIGGKQQEGTTLFEEDPRAAVQRVYDDVAQGDPENACGRFTEEARAQFADHFAAYGADCEEIVEALNAEVVDGQKSEYANPSRMSSVSRNPGTDSVTVSSCTLGVRGGPLLGALTVSRDPGSQGGNQWIVTGHEDEECTGEPSPPPTS
jgi:hypothetical protein